MVRQFLRHKNEVSLSGYAWNKNIYYKNKFYYFKRSHLMIHRFCVTKIGVPGTGRIIKWKPSLNGRALLICEKWMYQPPAVSLSGTCHRRLCLHLLAGPAAANARRSGGPLAAASDHSMDSKLEHILNRVGSKLRRCIHLLICSRANWTERAS